MIPRRRRRRRKFVTTVAYYARTNNYISSSSRILLLLFRATSILPLVTMLTMTSIGCFHRSGVWLTHAFRLGGTAIPSFALVSSSSYHTTSTLYLNRFLFDPSEVEYEHTPTVEEGTAAATAGLGTTPTPTGSPSPPVVVLPIDDYRTIHAAKILRLANGNTLRAGIVANAPTANTIATYSRNGSKTDRATIQWIPEGKIKKAAITKTGQPPGSLRITLHGIQKKKQDDDEEQKKDDEHRLPVNLILALPRPLQLGRILPMIAQLGVQHVILTGSHKVPKDYFGSHLFRHPEKITKLLIEGLCQAGDDVRVPDVSIVKDVRSLFATTTTMTKKDGSTNTTSETSLLDELFPLATHARVIAHPQRSASEKKPVRMGAIHFPPTTTTKTATVEKQQQKQLVVAIGPEGGWVEPEELDLFEAFGFQQITLGTRTLRSDCAVISLLSLANEVCLDSSSSHD